MSVYYDPMIAKLVVWDHDRDSALNRMKLALEDYKVIIITLIFILPLSSIVIQLLIALIILWILGNWSNQQYPFPE